MLYLIESGNYYKIGITGNLKNRLKNYNTCNPDWKLISSREGNLICEEALHKCFEKYWHRNEWFHKNDEIPYIFNNFHFPFYEKTGKHLDVTINDLHHKVFCSKSNIAEVELSLMELRMIHIFTEEIEVLYKEWKELLNLCKQTLAEYNEWQINHILNLPYPLTQTG